MEVSQAVIDDSLSSHLAEQADEVDLSGQWPTSSLVACKNAGVFGWFVPTEFGGLGWDDSQVADGYLLLSRSCLTTAFILTQWHAACRRFLSSTNEALRSRLLPKLASGELFTTVGISHLTTSRQHFSVPALRAIPTSSGFRLEGCSPWVTGAEHSDILVLGATLDDRSQILVAVPRDRSGVDVQPSLPLVALSASCTGPVELNRVEIHSDEVLAGPTENVMQGAAAGGGSAGGLHTSILALGLAERAVQYIEQQSLSRPSLLPIAGKMKADLSQLLEMLRRLTMNHDPVTTSQLRRQANTFVLRATQAALQSAKGAGFVAGHSTGRWAREALFFLVWSCPQAVLEANLCDLAGLDSYAEFSDKKI